MNNNFDYLDSRITTVGQAITGWETQLANVNTTLTNSFNNLNSAAVKLTGAQTITGNKTFSGTVTHKNNMTLTNACDLSCAGNATFTGVVKVPTSTSKGTALQLSAHSKSANGYMKLGNGLIFQWGEITKQDNSFSGDLTFPTAFSSETSYGFATGTHYYTGSGDGTSAHVYALQIKNRTSTGLKYFISGSYTSVYWVAIGY